MELINQRAVALIGAGGKTTLALALTLAFPGKRCLSTTTRMYPPAELPLLLNADWETVLRAWGKYDAVYIAGGALPKVSSPGEAQLRAMAAYADHTVIEADGAHGRLLKLHRDYEPVVPDFTDAVLSVAGMQALGMPRAEAFHRPEDVAGMLALDPAEPVTEADIARAIALTDHGYPNFTAVLNAVSDDAAGDRVARLLWDGYGIPSRKVHVHTGADRLGRIAEELFAQDTR